MRFALVVLLLAGCSRVDPPATTPPPKPLPADPVVKLDTMQVECDAMLAAIESLRQCPNLDEDEQYDYDGWIEATKRNFAAGKKATLEPNAEQAIAKACRVAKTSVDAAHQRCDAGPRPRQD